MRIDGNYAHGEVVEVLLTSALTMVVDMDGLFIYDERSVGGTTVYFLEDQLISQRQLYVLETSNASEEFILHFR